MTIHVPENQHLALPVGKFGKRIAQYLAQSRSGVDFLGRPDAGPVDGIHACEEAFDVHFGELAIPFELRCGHQPTRTGACRAGTVAQYPEQPCLEGGAPLEPVDPAKSCQPGVLNHVLRIVLGPDVRSGLSEHLGPEVLEGAAKRLWISFYKSLSKEGLNGQPLGDRAIRWGDVGIG